MNLSIIAGAVIALGSSAALAADHHAMSDAAMQFKASCKAFQAEYGGNTDCGCLAKAVSADEALAAEFAKITGPADFETAPAEVTGALAACAPKAE